MIEGESPVTPRTRLRTSLDRSLDEQFLMDEIYNEPDFDFDLGSFSDAGNLLPSFVKRELIKEVLKKQVNKLVNLNPVKSVATKFSSHPVVKKSKLEGRKLSKENLKNALAAKKKQLEQKIQTPPFLRTSDKVAFTLGIIVLLLTEFVLLCQPSSMYIWYSFLLFPLLSARYYFYSKAKFQYFMLDFCYFAQVMLLVYLYVVPSNSQWFQVVFCVSNGPLLAGIVMWRNSLVFHDLDKLTSVFIHIFPPLVTFCLRWYPIDPEFKGVCDSPDCTLSWIKIFVLTLFLYGAWQAIYLLKTEIVDRRKIESDHEIMTSARWMSQVKPHPVWKYMQKRGAGPNHAMPVLVGVQLVYTLATIAPTLLIFQYFTLHALYLAAVFLVCVWNGANFYFEIFSDTYSKRLRRFIEAQQAIENEHTKQQHQQHAAGSDLSSSSSSPTNPDLKTVLKDETKKNDNGTETEIFPPRTDSIDEMIHAHSE